MDTQIFIVQSFVALFLIIDPFGNIPTFITLLEKFKESDRILMTRRAVIFATLTLIILTLTGNAIFDLFGIKMYSFKIAGGILLLIISIEMLFGRKSRTQASDDVDVEREGIEITPLAIPLLAGPGSITTSVVFFDNAESDINRIFLIINIILIFLISYIILSKSSIIFRILGRTGTMVITRIMGLMLSAIAVQFILNGVSEAVVALNITI